MADSDLAELLWNVAMPMASVGGQYGGLGSDTRYWQAKGSLGYRW